MHRNSGAAQAIAVEREKKSAAGSGATLTSLLMKVSWLKLTLNRRVLKLQEERILNEKFRPWRVAFDRCMGNLFGSYSLYLFRGGHLVLTFVIWFHFFYMKFRQKELGVPDSAPNYWWKRIIPPVEFGAMHAILFQLAIIPLTMSRVSLAFLSRSTTLSIVVPFERMTEFHIFVGYCFCIVMVLSVVGFFSFFGKVCHEFKEGLDPADLCEKFTNEIMITGYCIFACTLIVLGSSYLRDKLSYEIFYNLHHFVFAMFLLALLHTLDDEFRKGSKVGKARSQTFRWFTTSLLIYFSDRAWALFSAFRRVPIKYTESTNDGTVIVLCLQKPPDFVYSAGQYAFLQVPAIDFTWHPFSIASSASSSELRFIIQVMKPKSWTYKLANLIEAQPVDAIEMNIMGGFGASVTDGQAYEEILAIGTSTGIVPMVSLMTERVKRLLLLSKEVGTEAFNPQAQQQSRLTLSDLDKGYKGGAKSSTFQNFTTSLEDDLSLARLQILQLRVRARQVSTRGQKCAYMRHLQRKERRDRWHTIVDLLVFVMLLFELWLLGTGFSWVALPEPTFPTDEHGRVLKVSMLIATTFYAIHLFYRLRTPSRFRRTLLEVINILIVALMIAVLVFWWDQDGAFSRPDTVKQVVRSGLSLWRLVFLWLASPAGRGIHSVERTLGQQLLGEKRFRLIWTLRSGDLVLGLAPELNDLMESLVNQMQTNWGAIKKFLTIEIYITEKDAEKVNQVRASLQGTLLEDHVFFRRPDLKRELLDMMRDQLSDAFFVGQGAGGRSLVTFCGSHRIATVLAQGVMQANTYAKSMGFWRQSMTFRQEFYGAVSGPAAPAKPCSPSNKLERKVFHSGTFSPSDGQDQVPSPDKNDRKLQKCDPPNALEADHTSRPAPDTPCSFVSCDPEALRDEAAQEMSI